VLLSARSGFKTDSNLVTARPLPGVLRDLVGATVTDWASLLPQVTFEVQSAIAGLAGPFGLWIEALEPVARPEGPAARVLAYYTTGPFAGRPALTEMPVENGRALYLAWYPTAAQAAALLTHLCEEAGITPLAKLPDGLIAARRGEYLILLNFADSPQQVTVQGKPVEVGARDIRIVT
jgi:beta-galactosidase